MFKKKKEKVKDTRTAQERFDEKAQQFSEKQVQFGKRYRYKTDRVTAYLIDLLIVTFLVSLLTCNTITNPYYGKVKDAYNEYQDIYNTEYEKISADGKITSVEATNLFKKSASSYRVYYIRNYFPTYFWYVVMVIFYFGLFAYMNDGATLGKKLYRFKVVDKETGKKPKLWQMLVRNIFGGSMLLCGTNIIALLSIIVMLVCKAAIPFIYISYFLTGFGYVIDLVYIMMYFFKRNSRTLDDIVAGTKVVSVPKKSVSNNN